MPQTRIVLFKELDGTVPIIDWLDALPRKARAKCLSRIWRLEALGHELRRPEADLLRDGIYELRVGLQGIHYRMLYFFHGNLAAVISHGFSKERAIPPAELQRAINRRTMFLANPAQHFEEVPDE